MLLLREWGREDETDRYGSASRNRLICQSHVTKGYGMCENTSMGILWLWKPLILHRKWTWVHPTNPLIQHAGISRNIHRIPWLHPRLRPISINDASGWSEPSVKAHILDCLSLKSFYVSSILLNPAGLWVWGTPESRPLCEVWHSSSGI